MSRPRVSRSGIAGHFYLTLIIVSEQAKVKGYLRFAKMPRTGAFRGSPCGSETSGSCGSPAYGITGVSSRNGLLRVSRAELDDVAEGRKKTLDVDVFGAADGIQGSSDFNFGYHPSACKLRDGTLWFPTYGGVVTVDPSKMSTNPATAGTGGARGGG